MATLSDQTKIDQSKMSAVHAQSPAIKVIVGDEGDFVKTPTDLIQSNVFYVNKSFLVHHSRYFKILLDTAPPRDVVRLQPPKGCDAEMFGCWLDALYQGKVDLSEDTAGGGLPELRGTYAFANFLGSSTFKNLIVDAVQSEWALDDWAPPDLFVATCDDPATDLLDDYVLECVAYKILKQGWTKDGSEEDWDYVVADESTENDHVPDRSTSFLRLVQRVDRLREEEVRGRLMDPTKRVDCRWHEHATMESRRQCHRFDNNSAVTESHLFTT
ncbi:uncharacterized protein PV06_07745 [Exophiala oligosperma]|uniref:BTB domain-containing protein n=1 Tax=Exophiala oligosperma TaxID=215243 RepID=A0A0D2DYG2_9EURO|nr:uncharacterized protein PV06_07745 [Exophiala oligosperma]KIW40559.1 hypothetical protein PV06_07745 [Exophiala oligosperma]